MTTASRNRGVDKFLEACAGLSPARSSGKSVGVRSHNPFYRHEGTYATPCCMGPNGKVHWTGYAVEAEHYDSRIAQQISDHIGRCQEAKSRR